jgi:hypothetical protein
MHQSRAGTTQPSEEADMTLIVSILSALTLGMGVFGIISPVGLNALVSHFRSKTGFSAAILLRLIFGVALWRVAPSSRLPAALRALGVVSVASALALPLLGLQRFQAIVSWWSRQSPVFVRTWSAVAIATGAFLLWSVR